MKKIIALTLFSFTLLSALANHYFVDSDTSFLSKVLSFGSALFFIVGLLLAIPFAQLPNFIFDPREWEKNKSIDDIVFKLRIRAVLFNNIAIGIFFLIVIVILTGFYFLVNPPITKMLDDKGALPTSLTIRIGSSVLLIFLVGILFRVFKYLLRVAAFYHSKGDALELSSKKPEIPFEKLMEIFTPGNYDMSDLEQSSIATNIIDMIKSKVGKS